MRKAVFLATLAALAVVLSLWCLFGGRPSVWGSFQNPETEKLLKQFVALKEKQAQADINNRPPEIRAMFGYAERGQWLALSNSVSGLQEHRRYWDSLGYGVRHWHGVRGAMEDVISDLSKMTGHPWEPPEPPALYGTTGEALYEICGAFNSFVTGDEKYTTEFGRDIIDSIPPGSVYFGGTDPGRYIVTAMCQVRPADHALFVLAQHSLTDESYLDYLRSIYGDKMYVPTSEDKEALFKEYAHFLSTNISIRTGADLVGLNGPLSKAIFDKCPTNEFFIEQSFPIDWMNPYLEPHGLIFKINRQPLAGLSAEIIRRDREFWRQSLTPKIGAWLTEEATVQTVAAFAEKTFARSDFDGFSGDRRFVQNSYACKMFCRERAAIAGLYAWRANHATDEPEKKRLNAEADFAFCQAWALCPYGYEATFPYVNFLISQNRLGDALLVAETVAALPQVKDDEFMKDLPGQVKQYQSEHPASAPAN